MIFNINLLELNLKNILEIERIYNTLLSSQDKEINVLFKDHIILNLNSDIEKGIYDLIKDEVYDKKNVSLKKIKKLFEDLKVLYYEKIY